MLKWISLIVLVWLGIPSHAEIYKWKGPDGKIHFSDREPKQPAELVRLKQAISEERIEQATEESKAFVSRQQRKTAFQKEEAAKEEKQSRERASKLAKKKRYCVGARRELKILKMRLAAYRTDKSGERTYIDDAQRASEIKEWNRNIRKYCE